MATSSIAQRQLRPSRAIAQDSDDGRITIFESNRAVWRGMPSELASRPELVAKFWPRSPEILKRAVVAERSFNGEERGRQRGCAPRSHRRSEPLPETAYLGTPVHRIIYIKDGREYRTPSFALIGNARKALELMRIRYGRAIMVG